GGESADHIADEHLTPTERRLITRLCELETREAKVQNGYKNISSLVADIAHQSKTPLSSILMYTEMSEHGEIIRTQTEKLSFLMDSLTKLAKCEGGLIAENLAPKENSVKELLRQVIEANYASADAKNISIHCDVPDDLTAVFDLRWTAEAVGNILDNAVKYSPDRSEISISACAYDMFVRIDITDHGCGIAEDELCNIWKRFYRGKNAENEKGVGIGLYLTANILNTEGGRVSAKSDENGSTFTVYLPKT
ncbi:MAG: HAMP domain-containing histidine kinase, partial [Clostridia bacterium]|nr:HAMP domain-containing histidine kinase [Clostridia bacterium]